MDKNGQFQAKNCHFKAFLERQEGNEEYSKMDETMVTITVYRCRSDKKNFGELLGQSKMAIFRLKMAILRSFLQGQEGNEEYSKMDETKVTSTVYHCHSDENIFGELLGHFEIQNGHFQAQNAHFKTFLILERQEGNE